MQRSPSSAGVPSPASVRSTAREQADRPVPSPAGDDFRFRPHILLVDAAPAELEVVGSQLQKLGYFIAYASDGVRAMALARAKTPALIVLDLFLPGIDGFELCRILRSEPATETVPIVFVTAAADETDRVVGLELGADDYVTKPFSARELLLRIRKLLSYARADAASASRSMHFPGISIDTGTHSVDVDGAPVALTATEFRLLLLLAGSDGVVQRRSHLLLEVRNFQSGIDSRTIDSHMRRLRRKLGSAGHYLETVRGVGYCFRVKHQSSKTRKNTGRSPSSLATSK